MVSPFAIYSAPDITEKKFSVDPNNERYKTTNGITTGPSAHVLGAGQVDVDKPSDPKLLAGGRTPTPLSILRMELTGLQDDINEFLTERMELAKNKKLKVQSQAEKQRIDKEITELLDGGDGDDEDNEDGSKS